MSNKIASIFSRMFFKAPQPVEQEYPLDDEIGKITDTLISDTVGPDGVITKELEKRLSKYDKNVNPISETEARAIMMSMIRLAVSKRKQLGENIGNSVERGGLFMRYYGNLQRVSRLAVACDTRNSYVKSVNADRDYFKQMKENLRESAFSDHARPREDQSEPPAPMDIFPTVEDLAGGEEV